MLDRRVRLNRGGIVALIRSRVESLPLKGSRAPHPARSRGLASCRAQDPLSEMVAGVRPDRLGGKSLEATDREIADREEIRDLIAAWARRLGADSILLRREGAVMMGERRVDQAKLFYGCCQANDKTSPLCR